MESNTQQAIGIAVNLLIFITLLTVALSLLTSTLKMSTRAGEIISDSSASYVGVIDEEVEEGYVYTYEDLLSIYAKNARQEDKISLYEVSFFVSNTAPDKVYSLSDYIEKVGNGNTYNPNPNLKFSLIVQENGIYTFKAKP